MSISQIGTGQYLTRCAVNTCVGSVAVGLQVEIAHHQTDLRPRIPNETYGIALFTPCMDHIEITTDYLKKLGFSYIEEINLRKLQEWAGVSGNESSSIKPEDLQRLKNLRNRS